MTTTQLLTRLNWRPLLGAALAVAILLAAAYWGGAANPGPLLYLGVALVLGVVVGFGVLTWWLFLSKLPAGHAARGSASSTPLLRQMLAILVTLSGAFFVIGGYWDEVWHRAYGLPFGEDFWWRPHQLIYGSLALGALFALGGLWFVLRGRGSLRQRFRAEPGIGLLAIMSCYLMFSVPLDPIWHEIYGVDISAWSLPHILLALGFTVVMLVAVAVQLSLVPQHGWRGLRGLTVQEGLALLPIAWGYFVFTQVATAEWEGLTLAQDSIRVPGFWSRPEWLYPVVMLLIGAFVGMFALHALRRVGVATLVAVIVIALRLLLLTGLDGWSAGLTAQSHFLLLVICVALDAVYALRLRSADAAATRILASLAAAAAMLTVGLLFIHTAMVYPRINADTLPGMIVFGVLIALASGQAGALIGGWVGGLNREAAQTQADVEQASRQAVRVGLVVLVAMTAFVVWFAATATPPVL